MRDVSLFILRSLLLVAICGGTALAQTPVYRFEIIREYPHDTFAFTQGLVLSGGALYESTGLYGSSTLRQVDLQTGSVLSRVDVPPEYFAEGMTIFQGKIFQLTWQSQTALVYDPGTFARVGQFFYAGEGWGLTHDDRYLIMSDGTSQIRFVDPATFQTVSSISVYDDERGSLTNINELEYINGEIYANIWLTNWIVRIDPVTGRVLGWIDFTGLLPVGTSADVLNGIAYDETSGHLLVTGKLWPSLFEVRLLVTPPANGASPDGTTVPSATEIVDDVGAVWTIGDNGAILRNNVHAASGLGTIILWKSGTIYVLGIDYNWWQWTGSGWVPLGPQVPGGNTTPPPGGNTSPDGTTVPSAMEIVDDVGAVWTIGDNGAILRNNVHAAGGLGSSILFIFFLLGGSS